MSDDMIERFDDGGRVYLRPLRPDDVTDDYLQWFRDGLVTEFLDAKDISHEEGVQYMLRGRATREYFMYALIARDNDQHFGNVKVGPIQWQHGISDLVTLIGARDRWGKGYATDAIRLGNRLAFEFYGLRKLSGGIIDGNEGSVKAYTRAGWVIEARLKGHHLVDGEARDRIVVSCFNPAFFGDGSHS
jgi:ribosomal-protein-alanine N-acetyltransferase